MTITLLPLDAGSADLSSGGGIGLDVLSGLLGTSGPVPKFTRFVASFNSTGLARAMDRRYDSVCTGLFNCNNARPGPMAHEGLLRLDHPYGRATSPICPIPTVRAMSTIWRNTSNRKVVIKSDPNTKMLAS